MNAWRLAVPAFVLIAFLAASVSTPVLASGLEPLTDGEMGSVSGQTDMKMVLQEAKKMDKLDVIFQEIRKRRSSTGLHLTVFKNQHTSTNRLISNSLTRSVGQELATAALENPTAAARLVTSDTAREMAKLAGESAKILGNLVGNFAGSR